MGVPTENTLCRFVRSKEWSTDTNGPLNGAFKGKRNKVTGKPEMSHWDRTAMNRRGHSIELLRVGNLQDYPYTFYLKPSDYISAALQAESKTLEPCRITIKYTPEGVAYEQAQWAYAHVDIIEDEQTEKSKAEFREYLRKRATNFRLCEHCDNIYPKDQINDANICHSCFSII